MEKVYFKTVNGFSAQEVKVSAGSYVLQPVEFQKDARILDIYWSGVFMSPRGLDEYGEREVPMRTVSRCEGCTGNRQLYFLSEGEAIAVCPGGNVRLQLNHALDLEGFDKLSPTLPALSIREMLETPSGNLTFIGIHGQAEDDTLFVEYRNDTDDFIELSGTYCLGTFMFTANPIDS